MSFTPIWHQWYWESETERDVNDAELGQMGKTIEALCAEISSTARDAAQVEFEKTCNEQGVLVFDSVSLASAWVASTRQIWLNNRYVTAYRIAVGVTVNFYSDRPLIGSPIAPLLLLGIQISVWKIVAILAAAFVVYAVLTRLVESLTTTKTVVRRYDEDGNLIEETIITEPNYLSIIIAIAGLIGALAVYRTLRD